MSIITNNTQLNEIRQKKHQEYMKKLEQEQIEKDNLEKVQFEQEQLKKNNLERVQYEQERQEQIKKDKIRLEEINIKNHQERLNMEQQQEQIKKDKIRLEQHQHHESINNYDNQEHFDMEQHGESVNNYHNQEHIDIEQHHENVNNYHNINMPINHQEYIDYSYSIIISLFNKDTIEQHNINDFVKNYILYNFYENIQNIEKNILYIFYISIKEICSTYENTDIELIINTIKLINMNDYFIHVIKKSDNIDNIKIIFQEFIKLIDYIRPSQ